MKTRKSKPRLLPGFFLRTVSLLLIPLHLSSILSPALQAAATGAEYSTAQPAAARPSLVRTPTEIKVNRTLPAYTPSSQSATLSADPSDAELGALRLFAHRLVPVEISGSGSVLKSVGRIFGGGKSTPTSPNDNRALATQLAVLQKSSDPRDTAPLQTFLQSNPQSRWAPSLRHELARRLFARGFFTRAITEWESVWKQVKDGRDAGSLAVGDEVLAQLLEACMGLSDTKRLTELIGAAEARPIGNVLEAKLVRAKQSVWLLKHKGGQNILCGPLALQGILRHEGRPFAPMRLDTATDDYIATGLPLSELRAYGGHYQLDLEMARRPARADIPVPCVMHSTGGHYSTLVERDGDNYFLVDRAMQFEGWVPRAAIDEQASGYFLVRRASLPASWEKVSAAEGKNIYGRDGLHGQEPNGPNSPDCNEGAGGDGGGGCCGMPTYSFNAKLAAVRIEDTPVGYAPPVGPPVYFRVAYKDLDDSKPATPPNFSNVGRVWAIDWVAWVDHVAGNLTASSRATVHVRGGGTEISTYKTATGRFGPNDRTFSTVTRTGAYSYTREMPDGSKEIYNTPDNPTAPNRVFLTQKLDPAGNALTYTYDAGLRLIAVTDAIGQVTTLEHNFATDPMKVTKVTDPFGRTALLGYNAQGQLNSLTDMIGLTSTFTYDATEFITSITTPYGTTIFTKVQGSPAYNRTVTATDPLGQQERIQFIEPIDLPTTAPAVPPTVKVGGVSVPFRAETARLGWRNSFYWSRQAMQQAPGDVRVARNYRWFTDANWLVTGVLESVKEPLEDPVWFNYPNQAVGSLPNYAGLGALPEKILRILPDGAPQLLQSYYNPLGAVTNAIDPLGRSRIYVYGSNQIDLLEVRQKTGSNTFDRLALITYNGQHMPLTLTDAAGQTATNTYNARGQLLSNTNPRGETRTLHYDANGYLLALDGPLPGTNDTMRFTYDAVGRTRTVTEVDGYTLTYAYDNLDRLTSISYPDGTVETQTYDRLDQIRSRDRLGRETHYTHDALQRVTSIRDPLGRITRYDYCECGALSALVDPMGRLTRWHHDVQGRMTAKEYADGSRQIYAYEKNTTRLKSVTDEKGQFTEYEYDLDDNRKRISYPNALVPTPAVSFTYDRNYNRLSSMRDGIGLTVVDFHPVGVLGALQTRSVDGPWTDDTVTYAYDQVGRVASRSINGTPQSLAYDPLGRITNVVNALGSFTYLYDDVTSRLRETLYPNGQRTRYDYFGNSGDRRLREISHLRPNASVISRFTYAHDAFGNTTNWVQEQAGAAQSWEIGYDAADQLRQVAVRENGVLTQTHAYTYDPAGNRLRDELNGTPRDFAYNALNELTTSSDAGTHSMTYEWDAENRLVAINASNSRSEFSYDGMGRRLKMVERVGGVVQQEKRFVWCGLEVCEERDASDAVVRRLYVEGQSEAGGAFFYNRDHLGSIRDLTDSSVNLRARYTYQPWGARTKVSGDAEAALGYTGLLEHPATGHTLTPTRFYSSRTARWLSRDMLEEAEVVEGVNLYAYVANNPLMYVDPSGQGKIGLLIRAVKGGWKYVNPSQARRALDKGGDVMVKGPGASGKAKGLAKDQWGDKATRHDPHGPGQRPHYQHKNGGRGHVFYSSPLAALTASYWLGDNLLGNALDFFNPLSDLNDLADLLNPDDDGC